MDAEIRAALRALRHPGVLESIPDEALEPVLREAMLRPGALVAAVTDEALNQMTEEELSKLAGSCYRIRYDKAQRRWVAEELARREAFESSAIATVTIQGPRRFDWTSVLANLRNVGRGTYLRVPMPQDAETRGEAVLSLRAAVRRRRSYLKVKLAPDKREAFIYQED